MGKVLLAGMGEEQAIKVIRTRGLTKYTENTIVDLDLYLSEIRLVRQRGYATDNEEYILGVRAVASPVLEESHLTAVIWAVGFKAGLDEGKMNSLVVETREAAEALRKKVQGQ